MKDYSRARQIKTGLARMLEQTLEELELSKSEFADRIDCSSSYISRCLSGKANFTIDTLVEFENGLGVKIFNESVIFADAPHNESILQDPKYSHIVIRKSGVILKDVLLLPGEKLEFEFKE